MKLYDKQEFVMRLLPTISFISVMALSLSAYGHYNAHADSPAETTTAASTGPLIVAELFTSQSCSSCPPAEALFSSLADQDNLLTIEWHVDYWDDLVHGGSKWKDLYSSKAFTARQRAYNWSIRGVGGVYTPQAIVNGQLEGVGSRRGEVTHMLENTEILPVDVQITNNKVVVGPSNQGADILFVRLLEKHQTNVKGGENKGRLLAGKNIVLEAEILGETGGKVKEFSLPSVGAGESCAVLVQTLDGELGPVLGAAKC